MPRKLLLGFLVIAALLLASAMIAGCAGPAAAPEPASAAAVLEPAGPAGPEGPAGATTIAMEPTQPESCVTCHGAAGAKHQASYDEMYQDGVIKVTDLQYSFSGPDESTVTFNMTKDGAPFDARKADSLAIYFAQYVDGTVSYTHLTLPTSDLV